MIEDTTDDTVLPQDLIARASLSVQKLARSVHRQDNGEPLLSQSAIEARGLRCDPFWDSAGDLEGSAYGSYIASRPDFSLQLRSDVVRRLEHAQSLLPQGWKLVLKAGYRPYEVQLGLLELLVDETSRKHPEWSDEKSLEHARMYVSDPRVVCPPHVTGGAVDVDVVDESGRMVDMGCPPNTDDEIAFLFSDKINPDAQGNRRELFDAMTTAGFAPLASEWWHYQYGETFWAAFYGHAHTKYDLIKL